MNFALAALDWPGVLDIVVGRVVQVDGAEWVFVVLVVLRLWI